MTEMTKEEFERARDRFMGLMVGPDPVKVWRDKAIALGAMNDRLRAALVHVRGIIKDGALTGFNCPDGDWTERLFASQGLTHAALAYQQPQPKEG